MVLTAWFISVIMSAKYLNGANDLFLNAVVIGLTLFTCINIGGEISGGCFNPAVGIAQRLFQNYVYKFPIKGEEYFENGWIYPVATWLGGVIAGVFKHVLVGAHESLKESAEYQYDLAT